MMGVNVVDTTICLSHQLLSIREARAFDLRLADHLESVHRDYSTVPRSPLLGLGLTATVTIATVQRTLFYQLC